MEEIRKCVVCGKEFVAHHYKASVCSEECKKVKKAEWGKEYHLTHYFPKKTTKKFQRQQERIAHQQDTSVWTRDYAERQKQKTLEMIGKIEIN